MKKIVIYIFIFLLHLGIKNSYAQDDSTKIKLYINNIDFYLKDNSNYNKIPILFDSLKFLINKTKSRPYFKLQYHILKAHYYTDIGNLDSAQIEIKIAYNISKKNNITSSKLYNEWGRIKYYAGDYKKAVEYLEKAYEIAKKNDKNLKLEILMNLGIAYKSLGLYNKALEKYITALKATNDTSLKITLLNNIAVIHKKQGNYYKALKYLKKAYNITKQSNNNTLIPLINLNIASIYLTLHKNDTAYKYLKPAVDSLKNKGNIVYYLQALSLLGDYYKNSHQYDKAFSLYSQLLDLQQKYGFNTIRTLADLAQLYKNFADSIKNKEYYNKALNYALKGMQLSQQKHSLDYLTKFYLILSKIYATYGNYKNAYKYAILFIDSNNVLFNMQKTKAIQELETKYETEKKQQEIEKQKLIIEKQKLQTKRDRAIQRSLISISILVIIIAFVLYRGYIRKKRDNEIIKRKNLLLEQANREIEAQKNLVQKQKEEIETIHKKLTDSISYAQRIQNAAMPKAEELAALFKEYFIIFKPLQVVSGDFYWVKRVNQYIILAVADCTGHGVPGAFVSMLGISLLNELVQKKEIIRTDILLEEMRKKVKIALGQLHDKTAQFDGMDIAVCAYNTENNTLQYSGANRPLIIISKDGKLTEYKPVKNPVAFYFAEKPFTYQKIDIQPDDIIYLFTDGITDQFNKENHKFSKRRLKQMLLEIYYLPLAEQKNIIEKKLNEWMQETEQLDDITIMGVKFS